MSKYIATFAVVATMLGASAFAGPITQIAKLSPRYNSDVIEIEWATPLVGGCNTSAAAVTNATAANNNELIAFLLSAFATSSDVEVFFGGGCGSDGTNWITTVRLIK